MKNLRLFAFSLVALFLGSFLFVACQREDSQPQVQEADFGDASTALHSARKVEYIVSRFYAQADEATIKMINAAYLQLSPEEVEKFIDLDFQRRIKAGEEAKMTALHRDYRKELNQYGLKHFNKTFNNLAQEELKAAHEAVMLDQKYASVGSGNLPGGRTQACTYWYPSGSIQIANIGVSNWQNPNEWALTGEYSFCYAGKPCQTDCDYLFRSRNYNRYYYSAYLWHTTPSSQNVLNWGGCSPCFLPSRRISVGTTEEYLQYGAGKDRVNVNYGFFPVNFGKEVIVKLTVR